MPTLRPFLFCIAALLAASQACGQDATTLIAQGDSLLETGKAPKAMAYFNAALKLGATADAYAARGRGWYAMGKYDQFLGDVRQALAMDSLHGKANYLRALYALRAEDREGAVAFATRVLQDNQPPALRQRALLVRGEALAATGATDRAIADLREGTAGTDDLEGLKTLARLYDAANFHDSSLVLLEKLCELEPLEIGNWSNRGFELNKLERFAEALPVLDRALTIDKDEPIVLSNKAYALLKLGRDQEAMAAVERSLRADRANPYALRTRALLWLRRGELDKACNDLTLAKAMGGAPEVDSLVKQHCSGMPAKR